MNNLTPGQLKVIVIGFAVAFVLVILIDAGMFIAWAFRKEDADAGRKPPLFSPQWSLVDVWAGGQIAFILLMIVSVGALIVTNPQVLVPHLGARAGDPMSNLPFLLITLVAQNVLLFGIPAAFIIGKYRIPLKQIGLPLSPSARQVFTGIRYAFVFMVLAFILEQVLTFVLKHALGAQIAKMLDELTKALTVEGLIKGKMTWGMFLVLLFGAGIAAPIGEEMFFRGFLYNCAKRRFGVTAGAIISAAIFALVHLGPIAVFVIFFMGIILALAYERTGSLWVTMIMHATNNSLLVIIMFILSRLGKT